MAGLDFERFGIGGNVILLELMIDDLVTRGARGHAWTACPALSSTTTCAQTVAELAVEVEVAKAFIDDHVERLISGRRTGRGRVDRQAELRRDLSPSVGLRRRTGALPSSPCASDPAVQQAKQRLRECWLWSRAYTVSGGSSEMMRNILAKRRLCCRVR